MPADVLYVTPLYADLRPAGGAGVPPVPPAAAVVVREVDGSPAAAGVSVIEVSNGTLSSPAAGVARIATGGGGLTAVPAGKTLYVEPTGNNTTAVRGDAAKPYQTPAAAKAAAQAGDLIHVRPGSYAANDLLKNGVHWHFESGATVTLDSTTLAAGVFDDSPAGANGPVVCRVTGGGVFDRAGDQPGNGYAATVVVRNAGSDVLIECDSILNRVGQGGNASPVYADAGRLTVRAARRLDSARYDAVLAFGGVVAVEAGEIAGGSAPGASGSAVEVNGPADVTVAARRLAGGGGESAVASYPGAAGRLVVQADRIAGRVEHDGPGETLVRGGTLAAAAGQEAVNCNSGTVRLDRCRVVAAAGVPPLVGAGTLELNATAVTDENGVTTSRTSVAALVPTAAPGTNTAQAASTAFVAAAVGVVLGGVSAAFDTLAELAAGLAGKQDADGDLAALAALAGTNTLYYRSAASVWSPVTVGAGLTFVGGTLAAPGGGGTPGGSNTQVQFNDGGALGGDAGLTFDKATDTLTVGGPVLLPNGSITAPAIAFSANTNVGFYQQIGGTTVYVASNASQVQFSSSGNKLVVRSNWVIGWAASGGPTETNQDTALARAAAGVIDLNNGTAGGGAATLRSVPLTPAALAADQNNYAPGVARTYRLEASGANRTLTGLAAGQNGEERYVHNAGAANNVVLAHESASSAAANRFDLPGAASVTIPPKETRRVWYDAVTSRWKV